MYRDESRQAYEQTDTRKNETRVIDHIERCGHAGATCDETMVALRLQHQTASPCFTALERSGKIQRTAERRLTRTGSRAAVYRLATGLLFAEPTQSRAELYREIIRAAMAARETGQWSDFDSAVARLPTREQARI